MVSDFESTYRAARRRYEIGRFGAACLHAAAKVVLVGALAGFTIGVGTLAWLPATFVVLVLVEWYGRALHRGAQRGYAAGLVALLFPLAMLRPCCAGDRAATLGASCCTMPSVCWAAGATLGLALSLVVPAGPAGKRWEAAMGMLLGVTAVTLVRCAGLFLAEAVGLLGGLLAGVFAASLARACSDRMRVRA